jgi:hypothetical protein
VFKKFFSFVMILSIFTVHANAASQNSLKAAFDELNYSLTVEWDQKDQDFYSKQMSAFSATVHGLQEQGLTNEQMLAFAKSEIKDAKVAKDLETTFNMISLNKMSSKDAAKYMMESMKKSYSVGASFNGEVFVYLAVGVLVVALAVAIASGNATVSTGGGYYCTDYYVCDTYCDYYGCWDDCYYTCY